MRQDKRTRERKRQAPRRSKQALRLWLRLLSCEDLAEQQIRSRMRREFGVTLPQFDVLSVLEHASAPLTMSQLSKELMVSNGNVTGVVDRLVRDGFVVRTPSPNDRRVQYIELTASGLTRFAAMAGQHESWVAELFSTLDGKEIDTLTGLLRKTRDSISERFVEK